MYVGPDTEEESQEEDPEIAGRVSDLENNEVDDINVARIDPIGQQEVCPDEDGLEVPDSVSMVLRVARQRRRGDGTSIGITRKPAGTCGNTKKKSRIN